VLKWQKIWARSINPRFLLYMTALVFPHIALKFGLLLHGQPLPPRILPQSEPPVDVDLSVGDIRCQIVAKWLRIAQWSRHSQWRACRKLSSFFRMVHH